MGIKENALNLIQEVENLRHQYQLQHEIKICAATKYVDAKGIKELLQAGIHHIGENRTDAFIEKYALLKDEAITWHFIGTLQTRKVKEVINQIDCLHSLDRIKLAEAIQRYREQPLDCFIQVNASFETSKHGISPNNVCDFILSLEKYDKIRVIGLMTMAEHTDDEKTLEATFQLMKDLQATVKHLNLSYAPCNELSMGMSNDYRIAIKAGATIIRVGSVLFK